MIPTTSPRILIFGASRGLGLQIAKIFAPHASLLLVSRKPAQEKILNSEFVSCDLSRPEQFDPLVEKIKEFNPQSIFYVAGGGPYGLFHEKSWKSHQWSFQVNFLTPAYFSHQCLQNPDLQQIVFVGSAIAESKADPMATSYSSSKFALRGLYENLKAEYPNKDIRLYSPGYMLTDLLPQNSLPRLQNQAMDPQLVAQDFQKWLTLNEPNKSHRIIFCLPEQ